MEFLLEDPSPSPNDALYRCVKAFCNPTDVGLLFFVPKGTVVATPVNGNIFKTFYWGPELVDEGFLEEVDDPELVGLLRQQVDAQTAVRVALEARDTKMETVTTPRVPGVPTIM